MQDNHYQYSIETTVGSANGQIFAESEDHAKELLKKQYGDGESFESLDEDRNVITKTVEVINIDLREAD